MLILAAVPFVGIALLVWKGSRSTSAKQYRAAVEDHDAEAAEEEALSDGLGTKIARLTDDQERLRKGLN